MKIIDRIILTIFSIIVLTESVLAIFLIFGWVAPQDLVAITTDALNNSTVYNIVFGSSIICIIFAIKAILFSSSYSKTQREAKKQDKIGEGVLLENEDGKLLISKETIERIANGVVEKFSNIKDSKTRVYIDIKNNISIIVELQILQSTVIKDLNSELQMRIKEAIKNATDLDVNEVNIKIKNIIPVPENDIVDDEEE